MIYWKIHSMKIELSKRCHTKILPSNELRKKLSYFPLYWLVYRDPYIWLIKIPIYLGRISSPIYNPTNQVFFSLLKYVLNSTQQLHPPKPALVPLPWTPNSLRSERWNLSQGRKNLAQKPGGLIAWCRWWWEILGKICFTKVFKRVFLKNGFAPEKTRVKRQTSTTVLPGKSSPVPKFWWGFPTPNFIPCGEFRVSNLLSHRLIFYP